MATASCNFPRLPFSRNNSLPTTVSPVSLPSSVRLFPPSTTTSPSPSPLLSLHRPSALSLGGPFPWVDGCAAVDPAELSVNPAVRNVNVLFCRSGYNVQIVVGEDEPEEVLLRRFRREVFRAGVIQECKRRKFFENKQEEKKRKAREAAKRNRRRRFGPRFSSSTSSNVDAAPKKARDDADDNWEMPEGDIP